MLKRVRDIKHLMVYLPTCFTPSKKRRYIDFVGEQTTRHHQYSIECNQLYARASFNLQNAVQQGAAHDAGNLARDRHRILPPISAYWPLDCISVI